MVNSDWRCLDAKEAKAKVSSRSNINVQNNDKNLVWVDTFWEIETIQRIMKQVCHNKLILLVVTLVWRYRLSAHVGSTV